MSQYYCEVCVLGRHLGITPNSWMKEIRYVLHGQESTTYDVEVGKGLITFINNWMTGSPMHANEAMFVIVDTDLI